ncbi:MAG: dephospho-CoA kinase [Myxococcaceae bacterium]|nr:dephospho-CoA kinase [Myxococcaceae bacterium]
MNPEKRLIGITGGIASGKSTVTNMLRALGAHVLDADALAREIVAPGSPGLAEIVARWPDVLGADGSLDRKRLGEHIFNAPADRKALDAITHPRIGALMLERTQALWARGERVVFYDAALLIENRLHEAMSGVIVVWVPRALQLERLMKRNGLTHEQAEARVASQLPLDDKRAYATWLIDNSGTLEATRAQVEKVWQEVN